MPIGHWGPGFIIPIKEIRYEFLKRVNRSPRTDFGKRKTMILQKQG